ncbi:MAG: GNAT family N-acetyltransferase [Clostridia bacterium]|nr:GNAT family N-acetyltransferase [Clostridia bacterium]
MEKTLDERFEFRNVHSDEAQQTADIEEICFPPNEACSRKMMVERVNAAPETFLVAVDRESGKIAGFLNGIATEESVFRDEFFMDAGLHHPSGENIMLLGLDVLPEYRMQGLGRALMTRYAEREKAKGRKKLYLTCLDNKVAMYSRMEFRDLGISGSVWGGEEWHDMVREL